MASTSTPKPQPSIPSVQQESTFEEDYFAELLLDDDEDAELDSVVKPKKKTREERMNEAVEISKREYRFEHGITEPWVSTGMTAPCHRTALSVSKADQTIVLVRIVSVVVVRSRSASASFREGSERL